MNAITDGPQSEEELRARILEIHDSLSKRMKQVGRYVLDHPDELAFETLAVLSERAGVQPSAIVRFAKILGYSGASQLQKVVRGGLLSNHITLAYGERVRQFNQTLSQSPDQQGQDVLNEHIEADILALQHLSGSISADDIAQAADYILKADTLYIAGMRRTFAVAAYLAYSFQQMGKRTIFIDGVGGFAQQQAHALSASDALIAISYQPYAEETAKVVQTAADCGATIIAITDSKVSPVAKPAAQVFQLREAEVRSFRSLAASFCLVQSLVIGYAFAAAAKDALPVFKE